jgi:FkbH-like protein
VGLLDTWKSQALIGVIMTPTTLPFQPVGVPSTRCYAHDKISSEPGRSHCGEPLLAMYQFDWANEKLWAREEPFRAPAATQLSHEQVDRTLLLHWQEHCVECAPPDCYSVCPLYVARSDRKCARFVYGVYPNPHFEGLLDRGADVRFRPWAKIETQLHGLSGVSVAQHRLLDRVDGAATKLVNASADVLQPINRKRRLNGALTVLRDWLLPRFPAHYGADYDDFVLECFAPEREPFRLMLEQTLGDAVVFRHAFEIEPGQNFHAIPARSFQFPTNGTASRLLIYPENDGQRRLVFTWLDFVKYQVASGRNGTMSDARQLPSVVERLDGASVGGAEVGAAPAAKVKCVAWDLDNTLWDGVLIEDTAQGCQVRDEAVALVHKLDERGILQTVVSKNNHDEAWQLLTELGIAEYFLYPAITWGQKSRSLQQVADALNINIDTFALIDDSPFERAEVEATLPMVRVYPDDAVEELLELPEFDVPVTAMSKRRRFSYREQEHRSAAEATFGGDYLDFLRSCEMKMRLYTPCDEAAVKRCLELIQRSNQLNLSGRRYSAEEFDELLTTPDVLPVAFECQDRFGDYGVVGFASVNERLETPLVLDFVLSCRVAQKRVEHTFFAWLAEREANRGCDVLRAELTKTTRNTPLVKVFDDLPFRVVAADGPKLLMEMSLDQAPEPDNIIELRAEVDP